MRVELAGGQAVLAVRGEVDLLTALDLGAIVDSMIDRGYRVVTLDLAACDFMDASGLRVIAGATGRLGSMGDMLTVRSPSALVVRMLDITGMTASLHLERSEPAPGLLGPEQASDVPSPPVDVDAGVGTSHREVTALPADDDVVDGALRLVVSLARATVGGADGVSVSLRRHGRLATVAASDKTISDMDADQYATGEGPCVDASVQGRWFHAEDLDTETRWPAFTPRAQTLGINAILSSPLTARGQPVGALNIYSRDAVAFARKDQELAAVFASEASTILTTAGLDVGYDELARRLQKAQRTRQTIALAQGAIMERDGIDEDHAYRQLREFSQKSFRPLRERAEDVVAATAGPSMIDTTSRGAKMADQPVDVLDQYRRDADLSYGELWLRYFELGGMATALELEAVLYGALRPSGHDREVIAHALNERFVELGGNHPVPYADG